MFVFVCIQMRRIHGKLIHRNDVTWHAWAMIIYVFTPQWIMTTVQWSHTSHYHLLTSRELHEFSLDPPTLYWPEKLVNNYRDVTSDASLNILPRFYSCIHQIGPKWLHSLRIEPRPWRCKCHALQSELQWKSLKIWRGSDHLIFWEVKEKCLSWYWEPLISDVFSVQIILFLLFSSCANI